nr:hypothetical protein [Erythrotrichia carnea]
MNKLMLAIILLNTIYSKLSILYRVQILKSPQLSYSYFERPKVNKTTLYQIHKKIIVFDKCNKQLNQFIRNQFNLNSLEKNHNSIGQQEINSLLIQMKTSGFFRSINIKSRIIDEQQRITIDCESMPIVKYIHITKNKGLIIPEKVVLNLFKNQLGKPLNFKLMNKSLKQIYEWYYEKGYQWVNIKIVQNQKEAINIQIEEGVLNSIQFKFTNQTEDVIQKRNAYLLLRVREFLHIKEEDRLNYYDIEAKLNELKQKQIFENCDYTVSKSKRQPDKLDLLISIYELPDKTTFLIGQNKHFSPGIIETIESKIFNSINKLFKEIVYSGNKIEIEKSIHQKYLTNINSNNSISKHSYNSQKIINKILTKTDHFFLGDLYEWYTNPIHFINSNNLGINYNAQNIGKQKEYIKLSFKFPSIYKNLILTYCKPWIAFYNRRNSLIQIKFVQQSFYSKHKKITELLSQIFNHKFIFLESLSTITTFKTKLNTQLNNDWGLKETLRIESIEQKQTGVKKRGEILFGKTIKDIQKSKMDEHTFMYSNSQIINNTYSNFISFDTKLKYNFNYNNDINWSSTGNNFMILSKYSIPLYKIKNYTLSNHFQKFSQRTVVKYTYYKNYNNAKQGKCFSHYLTFFDLEIGKLIGSSTFFPWIEKFELKFPNYIIKNRKNIPNFPRLLSRIRLENHIVSPQNHSIFVFWDYIYSDQRQLFYKNKDILNTVSKIIDNKNKNDRFSGGIGYQIKTSIQRLPPIRIEFSISSEYEKTIYFRIVEVLSSIAIHKKT